MFIEDELKIFIGFVSGKQKEKTMKGFQEVEAEQWENLELWFRQQVTLTFLMMDTDGGNMGKK